jgi:hypothetical protein
MEENEYINDDDMDDMDNEEQLYLMKKLFDSVMVFNSHFAHYIQQNNPDLFKRAIDYAKTFTEEDVPGIIMHYVEEEEEEKNEDKSS